MSVICSSTESSSTISPVVSSVHASRPTAVDEGLSCDPVNVTHAVSPYVDDTWVGSFQIPWAKCHSSLVDAVDKGIVPSALDVRELINHTMSDIFQHTRRASRPALRAIAKKIIQRQPKSFADYINGDMVADGENSIMLMLESRKENMNRRHPKEMKPTKPSQSVKYGCRNWAPVLPDDETYERLELRRQQLCAMHNDHTSGCSPQVEQMMTATYAYQRYHINCAMSVDEVMNKWPFLQQTVCILQHCKCLIGVDVESKLRTAIEAKVPLIHDYLSVSKSSVTRETLQCMHNVERRQWPLYFLHLIMSYFREDINYILRFYPVSVKPHAYCNQVIIGSDVVLEAMVVASRCMCILYTVLLQLWGTSGWWRGTVGKTSVSGRRTFPVLRSTCS